MGLFQLFSFGSRSKLTPNQQLDMSRVNRIRARTMKSLLNEKQYLAMLRNIEIMQMPKDERYQFMYRAG